jgi:hypothetical protein
MISRISLLGIVIAALALNALPSARADGVPVRLSPDTGVPELIFYHGMVLNHDLQVIEPTSENVSRILRLFAEGVAAGAPDDATRLKFADALKEVQVTVATDGDTEIRTYATLSRWLLKSYDPSKQASLEDMGKALEVWASIPAGPGADLPLEAKLKSLGIEAAREEVAPAVSYIDQCRNADVPIPPDFGQPGWQEIYPLDPNYSFVADSNSIAKVWVYVSPDPAKPGMCIGLPREDRVTEEIGLFGIICQSKTTSKACFWDNIDKVTHKRLTSEQSKVMKIAEIEDATMIGENCTNCHRGRNAFNIHPRTSLDFSKIFPTGTDAWYEPIAGRPTWGNPGPLQLEDGTQCGGCHKIPEVADDNNTGSIKSYCRILRQVVDKTMPPHEMPAGWLNPRDEFARDIAFLRGKCGGP